MKTIELEKSEIGIIFDLLSKERAKLRGLTEYTFDYQERQKLRLTVKTIDDILGKLKC